MAGSDIEKNRAGKGSAGGCNFNRIVGKSPTEVTFEQYLKGAERGKHIVVWG